jgi:hypothetical protein
MVDLNRFFLSLDILNNFLLGKHLGLVGRQLVLQDLNGLILLGKLRDCKPMLGYVLHHLHFQLLELLLELLITSTRETSFHTFERVSKIFVHFL